MCESDDESEVEASTSAGTDAPEVRDLLGPLVDEQQDEVHVGVALRRSPCPRCSSSVVLPALGGETMSPRWPLPTGAMMSITRRLISEPSPESSNASFGLIETRSWKWGSALYFSGSMPAGLRDFYEYAATVTTIAGEAFDLRPVAQAVVPCDRRTGRRRRRAAVGSSVRPA